MIKLGDYNLLKIVKSVDFGLYLDGDEAGEILLPQRYVTPQMRVGDEIQVFIYLDQDERPVATTETPLARVGDFACLEVAWTNEYGAFLRWGLMKDLFCPFREQKMRMDKYIALPPLHGEGSLKHGTAVDVLIWQKTDLGFKCIVDNRYQGQLYDDQVFQQLHTGDRLTAYIDHVREDGKIDLTLQPTGRRHTLDFAEVLLRYLYEHDGRCELGDKSPAEAIYARFQVSKKAYKKAIGDLYKRRLIQITDDGIALV